jgi:hypothetical protein
MLDLVVLKGGGAWKDILQELPQFRDIPLSVAQIVNKPTFGLLKVNFKGLIEGFVGRDYL